ncbi:MAG: two-component sensor histidine kinase [Zetaproteobacteria bacterium CG12_big_fil_rev_8_21_14_0_65_54_13]|nr:MAG: two-component sensor histidine kinase [Zetaproteobacteria bacterium CG23_combo_of_CG06-09_8_20_14_all_54_7]PIW51611.1 MAG: two-component sensor histidine kinase [Zetaproteobacteria bacterium CG12_big_fil_rev_8_21_14_0_65_54_13]PIX55432.1 MAG: two-component sensor histidine kinase [Zetaproteobacteria bacterium CG_4_10_14_3_um_filter_54_28]PJA28427.1 MAG: two-component sensor histidine kinase [Zetaproteobacteria bacterium CG_4_9_14_3_um_filter_54_145]
MRPDSVSLAAVPAPMIFLDTNARVLGCNVPAQEALGQSERRLVGLHISELFAPKMEIEGMLARLTPYSSVSDHQICILRSGMPVSLHLGYHDDGVSALFIPEAARAEVEEHTKRHEMAEAVARIALEMAHEVKNPLAALRGAAQWLAEQKDISQSNKEAVTQMLLGVDRIRDRIDAFLQVGPRAPVAMEMTNIHVLIQDVTVYQEGIQVRRVFDPSLPETLVHPARLRQAFENLWQNAVEAADSTIEWQTRMAPLVHLPGHSGQVLEVRITNDGRMVPPDLRDRLFEPYVTGKQRGSGLGLALVQQVVLEHGGRINMRSEKGRTTMILHLPILQKGDNK